MIDIHTRSNSPFTSEYWKWVGRRLTGKYSGPQAVCDSLLRGLESHNHHYLLNPRTPSGETSLVLSGTAVLREQIAYKRKGGLKQLIAGPNVVISPHHAERILCEPEIDHILVPSNWVRDAYVFLEPTIKNKIHVWAAGVADAPASSREGLIVIYNKMQDRSLSENAQKTAHDMGFETQIFTYGSFTHQQYLSALSHASAVVYISQSESQGLALQEAWAHDIPTFVFFTGTTEIAGLTWSDKHINAPYLSTVFGSFYTDDSSLKLLLERISEFHPQEQCRAKLSDRASAQQLLRIVSSS